MPSRNFGTSSKIKKNIDNYRTQYVFVFLVLLTTAVIYFSYGGYLFYKWSWLKAALIISLLTCLFPYAIEHEWYEKDPWKRKPVSFLEPTILFIMICVPIEIILVYPGLDRLGITSDGHFAGLMLALMIIHGVGFYIVGKGILNNKRGRNKFYDKD
jgi:hypothetical protein